VWERAIAEPNSRANEAIDLFCAFLGSAAGNLALILGARGGIYIGGGIIPRMGDRFDQSPFRARFEAKGRFKNYLEKIPTWVISSPVSPALQGASQALSLGIW
jgi:glucokinase